MIDLIKNYKKSLIIFSALFLIYTGAGFVLVPVVVKDLIQKNIAQRFLVNAQLEKVYFNPFTFELELTKLVIPQSGQLKRNRLELDKVYLNLEIFYLFRKEIRLKDLVLQQGFLDYTILSDTESNWKFNATEDVEVEDAKREPWSLTLEQVNFDQLSFQYSDYTLAQPLVLPLGPVGLKASQISTKLSEANSLDRLEINFGSQGRVILSGKTYINPVGFELGFDIQSIPFNFATSYMSDTTYLAVKSGTVNSVGVLKYASQNIEVKADAQLNDIEFISTKTQEPALKWKQLDLKTLHFKLLEKSVNIDQAHISELSAAVVLGKDGELNTKQYLIPTSPEQAAQKPYQILINHFNMTQSQLDYADLSLKPQFKAHIHDISGEISSISNQVDQVMKINLQGKVEAQGKFKSKGSYVKTATKPKLNLDMNFHNIEMTTFTPYSGKFAGYEISKGKMFLDLNYQLKNNKIKGKNEILLDQFTLGKKVESDKFSFVPIKLAVALMKDRDGKIKMSLPVEGDVDSPEFSYSSIIWIALKNAIINIAAAPFDFLKGLLGSSEAPSSIYFKPGLAELTEGQASKIAQVAKALVDRPQLILEIQGGYQLVDIELEKDPEVLKQLALSRAQIVQNEFVKNQVNAERLFLLSPLQLDERDAQAKTILNIKTKD